MGWFLQQTYFLMFDLCSDQTFFNVCERMYSNFFLLSSFASIKFVKLSENQTVYKHRHFLKLYRQTVEQNHPSNSITALLHYLVGPCKINSGQGPQKQLNISSIPEKQNSNNTNVESDVTGFSMLHKCPTQSVSVKKQQLLHCSLKVLLSLKSCSLFSHML